MISTMEVSDVSDELKRLSDGIKNDIQVTGHDTFARRLSQLSQVIGENNADADAWAACDLHQLIDPQSIITRYKYQESKTHKEIERKIALLEVARNVLIFVPLVVTWFGLSRAVESYGALLKSSSKDKDLSFLYLWQQGFEGRLHGWETLGFLSIITVCIISTIIILTLIVNIWSNQSENSALSNEEKAESMQDALTDALSRASLTLSSRRYQTQIDFVQRFDQIVKHFEAVSDKFGGTTESVLEHIGQERQLLNEVVTRQKEESEVFRSFKYDLVNNMQLIAAAVSKLSTTAEHLETSVDKLVDPIEKSVEQQEDLIIQIGHIRRELSDVLTTQKELTEQQNLETERLQDVLQTLDSTVQKGAEAAESVDAALQAQNTLFEQISEQQKTATQIFDDFQTNLQTNLQDFITQVSELSKVSGALNNAMGPLGPAIEELKKQNEEIITKAQTIGEKLEKIMREQTQLGERQYEWAQDMPGLLQELKTIAQHGSEFAVKSKRYLALQRTLTKSITSAYEDQVGILGNTQAAQEKVVTSIEGIENDLRQQGVRYIHDLGSVTSQLDNCATLLDEIRTSMIWLKNFA